MTAECGTGYLDLRRLAAYSGLSIRTLRSRLVDPIHPLPHFRVGGKILVSRAHFDTWVRQFRVSPGALPAITDLVDDVIAGLR